MGSAMSALGYQATPKTFFSSKPAYVPLRQAVAPSENTSLRMLLELYCPSLLSEFRPAWWLFKRVQPPLSSNFHVLTHHTSGHLQSVYGISSDSEPITYDRYAISRLTSCEPQAFTYFRRRLLRTKDGGTLSGYASQCSGAPLILRQGHRFCVNRFKKSHPR
jgi:hypothetical protein